MLMSVEGTGTYQLETGQEFGLIPSSHKQDTQGTINVTFKERSSNNCCNGKAISIQCYECVSLFLPFLRGMQNACALLYCPIRPV